MKRLGIIGLIFTLSISIGSVAPRGTVWAQSKTSKNTQTSAAAHGNAEYVTAELLKDYLYFVSADEMEGRDTPSRGLDTTAKFIALNLTRWGVKPAGDDGTYFQRIALRRTRIQPGQTHAEINGRNFSYGDDFLSTYVPGSVSAPLVYVGHGWQIKSKNINPYSSIDVKDKIVVYLGGIPKGVVEADLSGKQGEDWETPTEYARKHGAKGVILVPGFNTYINWKNSRDNAIERGLLQVEKFVSTSNTLPSITPSMAMLNVLFQGERRNASSALGHSASGEPDEPFEFSPGKKVSFDIAVKNDTEMTQNVMGVLEGSDPVLKSEYVAIGAHYDHVGKGPVSEDPHRFSAKKGDTSGDVIYNGADDDGSGTVSVLAIAEALSKGVRPKRSVLFVWHMGEEKGLWGSRYFAENPTIPLKQIVTQLNIDMIGRCKTDGDTNPANKNMPASNEVFLIGSKMMSTDLGEISERVNRSFLKLNFNYKYDDLRDTNNFFFRSDHYNYARKGIPIIFYMDGDHEDYHRPSDSAEKIDYQYMERVARTIFATAWELSNVPVRPKVDKDIPVLGEK